MNRAGRTRIVALRAAILVLLVAGASLREASQAGAGGSVGAAPVTPIQHLVVIFQENESFDHYFGSYPNATNQTGEPAFTAAAGTPSVDGFTTRLLTNNPNLNPPFRVDRLQGLSCFENGGYQAEQQAVNNGGMDKFVQQFKYTGGELAKSSRAFCPVDANGNHYATMGFFDGNTVTALWNYAQNFAMSDSNFGTTYGPSSIGAINLVAGTTGAVLCGPASGVYGSVLPCLTPDTPPFDNTTRPAPTNGQTGTLISDEDPLWDICSATDGTLAAMQGPNIGDLLNKTGVTWGWFEGGFTPDAQGKCSTAHPPVALDIATGLDPAADPYPRADYIPHHEPFQFYASTANPQHLPPTSTSMIGKTDQANHQYDITSFWQAVDAGNMPAVSFIKAPAYQDSHAGYSDPLDEQQFLVSTINRLEKSPAWASTAVVITYDDSNGYYDHVSPPNVNRSGTGLDRNCGGFSDDPPARCGYGPRLPLLVISPFARKSYVSHVTLDQTSSIRFIEDNWLSGARLGTTTFDRIAGPLTDLLNLSTAYPTPPVMLDPSTGLAAH